MVLLTQGGPSWAWCLTRVSLVSLAGSAALPWVSETCHIALVMETPEFRLGELDIDMAERG